MSPGIGLPPYAPRGLGAQGGPVPGHHHPPFPGGPPQDLEVRLTTKAHIHHPHHVQPRVAPLQPQEEEGFCVKMVEGVLPVWKRST
jgi:hypothetical protein